MKTTFKRFVAYLLCAVMVIGYIPAFSNTVSAAETATPVESTDNLLTAGTHNLNFETASSSDATKPAKWYALKARSWASHELTAGRTGGNALKITANAGGSDTYAVYSEAISVKDYQNKKLFFSMDLKSDTAGDGLNVYIYYYLNSDAPISYGTSELLGGTSVAYNAGTASTTEWKTVGTWLESSSRQTFTVPAGAQYARIFFYKAYTQVGVSYIDNIVLKPACDAHTYEDNLISTAIHSLNKCSINYYQRCDSCDMPYKSKYFTVSAHKALTKIPGIPATDTTEGRLEYWHCATCDGLYRDAAGTQEITDLNDLVIPVCYANLLADYNPSFEDGLNSSTNLPNYWTNFNADAAYVAGYVSTIQPGSAGLPEGAPSTAADGSYAINFDQDIGTSLTGKVFGIQSQKVVVSSYDALWTSFEVCGDASIVYYIMFYDANGNSPVNTTWRPNITVTPSSEWQRFTMETPVPEGAVKASVMLYKSYTSAYAGNTYVDNIFISETTLSTTASIFPEVPEEINYDWKVLTDQYPRVYFDADELAKIKAYIQSDTVGEIGYSGKQAYEGLIKAANKYVTQHEVDKSYSYTWKDTTITFPLNPKLEDMSDRDEFRQPPAANYANPYPYMTQATMRLQERIEVLSLAYLLSGEEKYGQIAVQYATDMCEWEYWVGKFETIESSDETSAQPMGYCVTAVATVYDLCNDLLTDQQKSDIETALIEKGLKPMYETCLPRMERGRDMDHYSTAMLACMAILNEDNIDTLAPYMDRAMQYANWMFNWYDLGHNEGFDYAECGIDPLIEMLMMAERVTGVVDHFDHPFIVNTLPKWTIGFVETAKGTTPGFSDSPYSAHYTIALSYLAKNGNKAAGYALMLGINTARLDLEAFQRLIYVGAFDEYVEKPADDFMNVTVLNNMGIGALRTGWEAMDKLLVMISDDYGVGHAHYESNAIFMAMNGSWLIKDPGYGSIQAAVDKTYFDMQYASNTIFVDNVAQTVKGAGKISQVMNSELYGHVMGSAPAAYGKIDAQLRIKKFDRHTIMLNHDSESYYVIFDDLAANDEHVYGWNMYHPLSDSQTLSGIASLDGVAFNEENVTAGNNLAVLQNGLVLRRNFVGAPLNFSAEYFTRDNVNFFGPLLRANSGSTKKYQFMTVMSVDQGSLYDTVIDVNHLLSERATNQTNQSDHGFSWSSSNASGSAILLPVSDPQVTMFRGGAVGDWISFPFYVEKEGEYLLSLNLGTSPSYNGKWQAYLDGQPIGEAYYAKGDAVDVVKVPMEMVNLNSGSHTIKLVLEGELNEDAEWGTLISVASVVLSEGNVHVTKTYDNETVLGAAIQYGTALRDIVLFNRGTGEMTADAFTANAEQATIMGLIGNDISEGFSVVNGISASYAGTALMNADGKMSVTVDYRKASNVLDSENAITQPVVEITTAADEQRILTVYVGNGTAYSATLDGSAVAPAFADGLMTVTVPAGEHTIVVTGEHTCSFDRMHAVEQYVKSEATCTAKAQYYYSCSCGAVGTESFEYGILADHRYSDMFDRTCNFSGCTYTREVDSCAGSVTSNNNTYGELTVDGSTVTITVNGKISASIDKLTGNPGFWIGFKLTAPFGADPSEIQIVYPDGTVRVLNNIKENVDGETVYANIAGDFTNLMGQTGTFQIDWNGDGIYDLSVVVDATNATQGAGIFIYTITNGIVTITDYIGTEQIVTIPSEIEGYPVVAIAAKAFYQKTGIEEVIIPNTVLQIGSYAFSESSIFRVRIPETVTQIGTYAFSKCASLTSVVLPNGATTVGSYVFNGCSNLEVVVVPASMKSFATASFGSCPKLKTVIYMGTISGWSSVTLNRNLNGATVHYIDGLTLDSDDVDHIVDVILVGKSASISAPAGFEWVNNGGKLVLSEATYDWNDQEDKTFDDALTDAILKGENIIAVGTDSNVSISLDSVAHIGSGALDLTFATDLMDITFDSDALLQMKLNAGAALKMELFTQKTVVSETVTRYNFVAMSDAQPIWDDTNAGGSAMVKIPVDNDDVIVYYVINDVRLEISANFVTVGEQLYVAFLASSSATYEVEEKASGPVADATLVMRNDGALNLAAYIGAQFSVTTEIAEKYDTVYIVITHNGEEKTFNLTKDSTGAIYFAEYGIAAKQMADAIDIALFATKDDVTYVGQVIEGWTIKTKLVGMLDQYYQWMSYGGAYKTTPELAAAMLAYGAAAQNQFSYNLDNLATNGVDAKYLALVPTEAPAMEAMPTFNNSGFKSSLYNPAFMLDDVIKASLTFAIGDKNIQNYKARVTINGVTEDYELTQYVAGGTAYPGYAYIIIDSIVAADLRNDFTVTIMKGETATSTTYTFSMENMAAKLMASRPDMITAIMNYADAAHARFRA